MTSPVDYTLCCQTVTVYRRTRSGIFRQEIPGCFLQWQEAESFDRTGRQQERNFLLIQPGEAQLIFPGDRVFEGIGPVIAEKDWAQFLPVRVAGLGQVAYATAYRWQGVFCHTEAGRK